MTRVRPRIVPLLVAFSLLLAGLRAEAAPDFTAARRHFQAGTQFFKDGKFVEAAIEFEAAYAIVRDPILLFNIGQAYERAGEKQRAVDNYQAYLNQLPNAADRAQVSARMEALKRELAQVTVLPPQQGGERRKESYQPIADDGMRPVGKGLRICGYVLAAVAVASLGAGLGLGLLARAKANEVSDASRVPGTSYASVAATEARGKDLEKGAYAAFGVGGAAAITSVVLFVVDARKRAASERRLAVTPILGPGVGGVGAGVRF